ncbi:hypothetical protein BDK51DRAFT_35140, partial [Blyttiomyces helicus]
MTVPEVSSILVLISDKSTPPSSGFTGRMNVIGVPVGTRRPSHTRPNHQWLSAPLRVAHGGRRSSRVHNDDPSLTFRIVPQPIPQERFHDGIAQAGEGLAEMVSAVGCLESVLPGAQGVGEVYFMLGGWGEVGRKVRVPKTPLPATRTSGYYPQPRYQGWEEGQHLIAQDGGACQCNIEAHPIATTCSPSRLGRTSAT